MSAETSLDKNSGRLKTLSHWTEEEVSELIRRRQSGESWKDTEAAFPNRTSNAIKTKYTILKGKMKMSVRELSYTDVSSGISELDSDGDSVIVDHTPCTSISRESASPPSEARPARRSVTVLTYRRPQKSPPIFSENEKGRPSLDEEGESTPQPVPEGSNIEGLHLSKRRRLDVDSDSPDDTTDEPAINSGNFGTIMVAAHMAYEEVKSQLGTKSREKEAATKLAHSLQAEIAAQKARESQVREQLAAVSSSDNEKSRTIEALNKALECERDTALTKESELTTKCMKFESERETLKRGFDQYCDGMQQRLEDQVKKAGDRATQAENRAAQVEDQLKQARRLSFSLDRTLRTPRHDAAPKNEATNDCSAKYDPPARSALVQNASILAGGTDWSDCIYVPASTPVPQSRQHSL